MAFIRMVDGTERVVSPEQGLMIWQVKTGKLKPNKTQQLFCDKVKKVYLNWRTAPTDYLLENRGLLQQMKTD